MNVSPLDLRQQRFRSKFRGFDKVEVAAFLTAVSEDYESALRDTDRLRQELATTVAALNEHRENEINLRSTLTNTTAAESVIRDTDFAAETANFSKYQVLMQVGATVLQQSNQTSQLVLGLLK